MNQPLFFVRTFFILLSILIIFSFFIHSPSQVTAAKVVLGVLLTLGVATLLILFEKKAKRMQLKLFNTMTLGVFFGYLMALALLSLFHLVTGGILAEPFKVGVIFFSLYVGLILTLRASEEIHISLPFIRFTPSSTKIKEIVVDAAALSDLRLIDLASSGLLDERCVIPRFLVQEFQQLEESTSEQAQTKAKRALELMRKLETLPNLRLRYVDNDFPDIKESREKIVQLALLLNASVLSSESGQLQVSDIQGEGIQVINLHALANALKPLMQRGEHLKIKIQRYGKEEGQGVGYLDDGTMVVVNGGGDYLGEAVKGKVLSVKHTSSGRMIFCNLDEEERVFAK